METAALNEPKAFRNSGIPARVPLMEHLPLDFPLSVHIFASYFCNFKCEYCVHSLSQEQQAQMGFVKQLMPVRVLRKVVDDVMHAGKRLNAMIFAGHGEPLTNPHIADMVAYATAHKVARRVEIVSNGSLLTRKMSDALLGAGLDRLRISLQGLNEGDYIRVCGTKIDFKAFVANLAYYNEHKRDTAGSESNQAVSGRNGYPNLFIKIIDIALTQPGAAEAFHALFDPVCDAAAIEHLFPFIAQIDHARLGGALTHTKHGDNMAGHADICAMPFYMLVVLPNGDVTGCCAVEPPVIYGNVLDSNILDIWNNAKRLSFLKTQISGRFTNKACAKCTVPDYGMQPEDYLDEHKEQLSNIYKD